MHNAAFADHMERWGQLNRGVEEEAAGAAFLRPAQETLNQARAEAWEAKQRQLYHRAAAQQATRDLEAAMARAHEAASRLQHGLLGYYGDTNPKLVVFGMHPRRVGKARARLKAREALAALKGGTSPHPSPEPAPQEAAAPSAGGAVPQAEADAAALSPVAPTRGGEAPQAEGEVAERGGTVPPAVEAAPTEVGDTVPAGSASQPAVRIIPFVLPRTPDEIVGAAPAA
jgi:hypothetical protein